MSFVRHVIFLHAPLLPCWKLFECSSCGGPVIPRMYAVDVSRPVRDLLLSQGKPSSTSEGENPLQSLRGSISTTPSSPLYASYWPLQSRKCPASLIQHHHLPMPALHKKYLLWVTEKKELWRGFVVLRRSLVSLFDKLKSEWLRTEYSANFCVVSMIKKLVLPCTFLYLLRLDMKTNIIACPRSFTLLFAAFFITDCEKLINYSHHCESIFHPAQWIIE